MKWILRRIFKRIKQRYPVEVFIDGKRVIAGSATITTIADGEYEAEIKFKRPFK